MILTSLVTSFPLIVRGLSKFWDSRLNKMEWMHVLHFDMNCLHYILHMCLGFQIWSIILFEMLLDHDLNHWIGFHESGFISQKRIIIFLKTFFYYLQKNKTIFEKWIGNEISHVIIFMTNGIVFSCLNFCYNQKPIFQFKKINCKHIL